MPKWESYSQSTLKEHKSLETAGAQCGLGCLEPPGLRTAPRSGYTGAMGCCGQEEDAERLFLAVAWGCC